MVFLIFRYGWLSYRPTFIIMGAAAFVGALAIVKFPPSARGTASQDGFETRPDRMEPSLPLVLLDLHAGRGQTAGLLLVRIVGAGQPVRSGRGRSVAGPPGRHLRLHGHRANIRPRGRSLRRAPDPLTRQRGVHRGVGRVRARQQRDHGLRLLLRLRGHRTGGLHRRFDLPAQDLRSSRTSHRV